MKRRIVDTGLIVWFSRWNRTIFFDERNDHGTAGLLFATKVGAHGMKIVVEPMGILITDFADLVNNGIRHLVLLVPAFLGAWRQ